MAKLKRLQKKLIRSFRLKAYNKTKNQYFHAIKKAKTSCWNALLKKAQRKEVFTALKYTKEKTLQTIPSLQYNKDGNAKPVKSFDD